MDGWMFRAKLMTNAKFCITIK